MIPPVFLKLQLTVKLSAEKASAEAKVQFPAYHQYAAFLANI